MVSDTEVLVVLTPCDDDPFAALQAARAPRWLQQHRFYHGAWRGRLAALCARRGVTLRTTDDLLAAADAGAGIVVAGLARKIPDELLERFGPRALNVHPSLLPDLRGPQPEAQAILRGDRAGGVTTHTMTKRFDDGPIRYAAYALGPLATVGHMEAVAARSTPRAGYGRSRSARRAAGPRSYRPAAVRITARTTAPFSRSALTSRSPTCAGGFGSARRGMRSTMLARRACTRSPCGYGPVAGPSRSTSRTVACTCTPTSPRRTARSRPAPAPAERQAQRRRVPESARPAARHRRAGAEQPRTRGGRAGRTRRAGHPRGSPAR